jgi:cation diffusion facilitator family transporter
MQQADHSHFRHSHDFALDSLGAERRTRIVIVITAAMMVLEIGVGIASNSMALLADGWHMGTHVTAFLITATAYYFSRRHATNPLHSFGTAKIGVLGGFASAVVLVVIALLMAGESMRRFFAPVPIHFNEAIAIATLGLLVNVTCALVLMHKHEHAHADAGHHHQHHHDLNLRAAYLHVIADAFTSITAITALLAVKFFGWSWLDPAVGILGSGVVMSWSYSLIRDTSGILLDRTPAGSELPDKIRRAVERDGDSTVTDLHVWQVGVGKFAAIVSIVAHEPKTSDQYRGLLSQYQELVHVTIETQHCREDHETLRGS